MPKIKCLPEDFRVEELTEFRPEGHGPFACYRLTKRGMGTPEVIEAVCRRWRIDRQRVSVGGLKDRHAVTSQYLTIQGGPRRRLRQSSFELAYLGQATRAYNSQDITANRFRMVLRAMSREAVAEAEAALTQALCDGLPNYFDDQRFGSVGRSGRFMARAWIEGDYEQALWLAVAEPNDHDRPKQRRQKRLLREHWGDWPQCRQRVQLPELGPLFGQLCQRPDDFRRALARLRPERRRLHLAAFQSYLWNRLLAARLRQLCPPASLAEVPGRCGPLLMFRSLETDARRTLQNELLPLPSARIHLEPGPLKSLLDQSLAELDLTLRQLRVKYPRDSFFSKGWRPAVFFLSELSYQAGADELYPGRQKLTIACHLPPGSYGTMVVKRVVLQAARAGDVPV